MLNKLLEMLRRYHMTEPGDTVICAVSGGADSMALLWGLYLLKDKLGIHVCGAHFNHRLRGEESDADERFVRDFCARFEIPLYVGAANVIAGEKGLEAAAREARYAFLRALPGKIATAHTANDNAETVLMHLVRGTGLKGLGAIAPVGDGLIRPMLLVTREQVLDFLREYALCHVEDSSNHTDQFLRNRLRHHVMPLLYAENPRLAENLSEMALRLREDERTLSSLGQAEEMPEIHALREMPKAVRCRALAGFLKKNGVREPEAEHIALAESLVFSENPSARADFPGGVTVCRKYGHLEAGGEKTSVAQTVLPCPGTVALPSLGLRVICRPAETPENGTDAFIVEPVGKMILRSRKPGDEMRLPGGTKSLKKLFIDRKIPAEERAAVPVLADELGVLGVYGIGPNRARVPENVRGVEIRFEKVEPSGKL